MKLINRITDDAIQRIFLTGVNGERIEITLKYMASQECWIVDIAVDDFDLKGYRIGTSLNFLRQFKNIINFGLSCDTLNGLDPTRPDDFLLQRANLFLLTAEEVQQIEDEYFK